MKNGLCHRFLLFSVLSPPFTSYKYCPKVELLAESVHDSQDLVIVVGSFFLMMVKSQDIG
jgi:hypothetical protein